jgi:dipeptidyl aminopeptidase/acylaminoacyl peptidase
VIHQWLANRGYVVLSVNFRGSSGFGKKFLNAGNGEWGKKMHNDIIDAVNWTISNKIADPSKIGIMGASYGGYEVLISLTLTPDIFACGIDKVGPSDLVSFIRNTPLYWKPSDSRRKIQIGDPGTQDGLRKLRLVSPINFANNITKPLFIAQGANDPRVRRDQSDKIVALLRKRNIPVIYAVYQNEGHIFRKESNNLSFYAIAEQFLAKTLKGRFEPMKEDLNDADVILNGPVMETKEKLFHDDDGVERLIKAPKN